MYFAALSEIVALEISLESCFTGSFHFIMLDMEERCLTQLERRLNTLYHANYISKKGTWHKLVRKLVRDWYFH